jgi:flagellar assembly protein FliH
MTSQSESAKTISANRAVTGQALVRLVGTDVREVSRLEFYPLDRPKIVDDVELDNEAGGAELLLKEEMAVLDGQLRSQAELISAQVAMERSEAKADARREWEMELEQRIAEERAHVLKIGEQFRRERSEYFAGVESEVVKLALAIAKRVLHRELQLDPLLLAGVVRVALEKLADESTAVLRVPAKELQVWQEVFVMKLGSSFQVLADERLKSGECVLDTNVGKVELGVSAQLEEIERGFFDLMQQRPV